ncbi:UNVERIFIED_CONTAM: hypothetical protein FKN15_055111 [Acipenser sinensis]
MSNSLGLPNVNLVWNRQLYVLIPVNRCNPLRLFRETAADTRIPPKRALPSFFTLQVHSEAIRPIVLEDNTDLNGSTADLQAPYRPQESLVRGELRITLPT